MPALKVFRRRWYLGSDDLVYSSLLELTIRILWLVALMAVYFIQLDQNTCSDGYKIKLFYVGTMIFLAIYTAINVAIATTSAHGSIMDVHPRRHVVTLLYIKFAVFIPEVVWAILATWWIFNLAVDCGPVTILLAKAAVITEWIIIVCLLTSVYLICRFMCCCLHHDENRADAFEEVATLLTLFFHGRDLVLTDILAGVILLSAKQRYDRQMNFNPIMDVSEADTLRIRRCYRLDYQGISITEKDGHHINTNNIHTDIGIDPGQNNVGISDSRKDHHSGNDSGADIQTESRTFSENSVNAGQESRFYVESEKTRLYDRKDRHVPDYGTSASEDRTQFRQTESIPHLVRGGSVVSTTDSWMSNESELCPGFTPPRGPQKWMTLENAAYYLRYATAIYGSSNYAGCYNCSDRIPLCRKYR
ncbi:hypothetical protein LSH36_26g07138 [Paralvinella palmiformis]|uniref:Uncharacterized protein n=1 Tax=Paralvinella palmiformis TaxID=53620 RepID=A0AAD9KAG7_9ANNE|nr:hypothetical protein LSH36_26g07138 [Paralvinella palmiformis]